MNCIDAPARHAPGPGVRRRQPAEWERQGGALLTWPRPDGDWGSAYRDVETSYAELVSAIAARQPVLLCCTAGQRGEIRARLARCGAPDDQIHLATVASNDCWARDYGPVSVEEDGAPRLIDFRFDGWGGKFPAHRDDQVARTLARAGWFSDAPLERIETVAEGGNLDSDGAGTLLTTERCLRHASRNGNSTRADWGRLLGRSLGTRRVLWIEHGGLPGDDTDGHVDTLVRFAGADTLVYASCDDPQRAAQTGLAALRQQLGSLRRANGEPYRLIPLPLPAPLHGRDGVPLPASPVNFLLVNGAVLVPGHDDPADAIAAERLAACFPERSLVSIDARPLLQQNGSLHCAAMTLGTDVLRSVL